jgi:molybdopterin synthase sulfur carrier subunit
MKVKMKFFASIRQTTGISESEVIVPDNINTRELLELVKKMYNQFSEKTILYAVNGEYVGEEVKLNEGDVIAFFPPVSGG